MSGHDADGRRDPRHDRPQLTRRPDRSGSAADPREPDLHADRSGYPPGVPATYGYPHVALGRLLDDAVRDFPDVPATLVGGDGRTYARFGDDVARLAAGLATLGVSKGDPVVLGDVDAATAATVAFAVWRLGAVLAPTAAATPAALAAVVRDVAPRLIIAPPPEAERPATVAVVTVRRSRWRRPGRGRAAVPSLADLVATMPLAAVADVEPGAPAVRLPDVPDGADVLAHADLVAAAFQWRLWIPDVHSGQERVVVAAPWSRPGVLATGILSTVLAGGTIVAAGVDDRVRRRAAECGGTLLVGTSSTLEAIARDGRRGRDPDRLRACFVADGSPAPELVRAVVRRTGGARVRSYRTIAGAGGPVLATPVYGRHATGDLGRPLTDTAVSVGRADHHRRAPGVHGPLVVAGPQLASLRWDDGDAVPVPGPRWRPSALWARAEHDGSFATVPPEVEQRDGASGR